MFVGKYQEPSTPGNSGTRVWQTYLGGSNSDNPYALDIGTDGYIYIAGITNSNLSKTYGSGFSGRQLDAKNNYRRQRTAGIYCQSE